MDKILVEMESGVHEGGSHGQDPSRKGEYCP